jgi:hypothetical protein
MYFCSLILAYSAKIEIHFYLVRQGTRSTLQAPQPFKMPSLFSHTYVIGHRVDVDIPDHIEAEDMGQFMYMFADYIRKFLAPILDKYGLGLHFLCNRFGAEEENEDQAIPEIIIGSIVGTTVPEIVAMNEKVRLLMENERDTIAGLINIKLIDSVVRVHSGAYMYTKFPRPFAFPNDEEKLEVIENIRSQCAVAK